MLKSVRGVAARRITDHPPRAKHGGWRVFDVMPLARALFLEKLAEFALKGVERGAPHRRHQAVLDVFVDPFDFFFLCGSIVHSIQAHRRMTP
ncbi:MAG TPA: hypothetical protein VHD14_18560 [Pseudolabrys sp.]|nr:hypothetical protein [Pseudolabrys sp.]